MLPLLVLLLLLVQVAATSTSAPAFQAPKMLPHGVLRTAHERKAHLKMAEHAADASSLMRGKGIEATHDGLHHSSLKAKQMLDKLDIYSTISVTLCVNIINWGNPCHWSAEGAVIF